MARLSKEQKMQMAEASARLREEQAWNEFKEWYPRQLLYLVYEYNKRPELDNRLDEEKDSFVFSRPREMKEKWLPIELKDQPENVWELINIFDEVRFELAQLVEAEIEANRLYSLRQKALSKLSPEERATLNL